MGLVLIMLNLSGKKEKKMENLIIVFENILMYLIYLVGSFSVAKFVKDEDRYYLNRKKYILLSVILWILITFININLSLKFILFSLVVGILFNQLCEEKISRLISSSLYIGFVCGVIYSIKLFVDVKIIVIELIALIILLVLDKCIYRFNVSKDVVKNIDKKSIIKGSISYIGIIGIVIIGTYLFSKNIDMNSEISLIILMVNLL